MRPPPGAMVIFNGNKLWHAIAPLEAGAERIVLTMEYVTNPTMGPFHRFISNMKDAIAYFGFSAVLRGALSHQRRDSPERTSRPPGQSGRRSSLITFPAASLVATHLSGLSALPSSGMPSATTFGNRILHVV